MAVSWVGEVLAAGLVRAALPATPGFAGFLRAVLSWSFTGRRALVERRAIYLLSPAGIAPDKPAFPTIVLIVIDATTG